jgi:hypothetical protein
MPVTLVDHRFRDVPCRVAQLPPDHFVMHNPHFSSPLISLRLGLSLSVAEMRFERRMGQKQYSVKCAAHG